jgi:hypothetical protein
MDVFDRFRQWADKPPESLLTNSADLHRVVMDLAPEDRLDGKKVNEAAGQRPGPPTSGRKLESSQSRWAHGVGPALLPAEHLRRLAVQIPIGCQCFEDSPGHLTLSKPIIRSAWSTLLKRGAGTDRC